MFMASTAPAGQTWAAWAKEFAGKFETHSEPRSAAAPDASAPLITFVEPDESFLSQSIRGFGLSLATLGLYSFWARADARRQLHRAIRIDGQPLDFTGTGGEALASFVMGTVTTLVLVSAFLYFFYAQTAIDAEQARTVLSDFRYRRLFISMPLLFLLGSVAYRKRKHILRRTWWRGEHFDLDGQPWAYAAQHFWTAFLVPLTLGWAGPWRMSRLEHRKLNEMHRGTQRFKANGSVAPLYRAFAALWFGGGAIYVATMVLLGLTIGDPLLRAVNQHTLAPLLQPAIYTTGLSVLGLGLAPVLGFILFYRAAWIEHQISSLTFDGHRLQITLPKARFALLMLWNGFIKIISFGAFQPVADAALVRFVLNRITTLPAGQ